MIETYLILYCVDACTTYLMDCIIENGNNYIIEQAQLGNPSGIELKIYSNVEKLCYSVLIGTTVTMVVTMGMCTAAAAVPIFVPIGMTVLTQLQQAA
jgi:hypothetical protein